MLKRNRVIPAQRSRKALIMGTCTHKYRFPFILSQILDIFGNGIGNVGSYPHGINPPLIYELTRYTYHISSFETNTKPNAAPF
jgi:hypothetical protein